MKSFIILTVVSLSLALLVGCASPTPTPTPTPIPPNWISLEVEQDRLTDTKSVSFYTVATGHNIEPLYDAPALVVRCSSSNEYLFEDHSWAAVSSEPLKVLDGRIKVFVYWGGQYVAADDDRPDAGVRFDSHPPFFEYWYESDDNEKTYTPFPEDFVYRANRAESVYIELTDLSEEKLAAEFELDGLDGAMAAHSDLCETPVITVREGESSSGRVVSFEVFSTDYEPVFELPIPTLNFACLRERRQNSISLYAGHIKSAITVQLDSQAPYSVNQEVSGRLKMVPVANVRNSDVVIIQATLESGSNMRAEFDVSELDALMNAHPFCGG